MTSFNFEFDFTSAHKYQIIILAKFFQFSSYKKYEIELCDSRKN